MQCQATLGLPKITRHPSHCTLHTPHFTLRTSHSTLHLISSHLSSSRQISPHLSSSHLISSHLISSQMSSKFFSGIFISSEHCSTLLISSKLFLIHLGSSVRQKAFTVREKLFCTEKLLDTDAFTQKSSCSQKAFSHGNLWHRSFYRQKIFTEKLFTQSLLYAQNGNRMRKVLPSTTLYFPVLLGTTSLHKARHSTTSYFKACTKYFPVLLCTTRHAQSTSQYYFVPQSLYKTLASLIYIYISIILFP